MYLIKRKQRRRNFISTGIIILVVLFVSCNKDEVDNQQKTLDINGFWIMQEDVTGNCSGSSETENNTEVYSVRQSGSDLEITLYPNQDIIQGRLDGNVLSWSGTVPTINGNLDIDFSGTVNAEGNEINGEGDWQWYNDSYNCSGTIAASGSKIIGEDIDFSGNWNGLWESEENNIEGGFSANISQNGNSLGGTISVSGIGMENATLSGMVHGNVVYFGDVGGVIKFVGILKDGLASGGYSYNSLSDEGTWTASHVSEASIRKLTIADTFQIETGCKDMTYDGEKFYLLSQNEIICISKTGTTLFKYPAPGNHSEGIAYNGEYLLVGDNGWGTNKIYKMQPSVVNIVNLPADGDVIGASAGNDGYWFGSRGNNELLIYKTTIDGTVTESFSFPGRHIHGLCTDNENIWVSYEDTEMFSNTVLAKLDQKGNLLDTFRLPDGQYGRLTFDGEHLWLFSDAALYSFDDKGNVVGTLHIQEPESIGRVVGLTFDGDYFWCATSGELSSPDKILRIDPGTGQITSSFQCPGTSSVALAYDGEYLRLADKVTQRLYTLPKSGDYYLPFPSFDFSAMSAGEEYLYVYNSSDEKMVTLDNSAMEVNSFSITLEWNGNFYFDGQYYWTAENLPTGGLKRIIKYTSEGKKAAYFQSDNSINSVYSLIVVGDEIWCIANSGNNGFQLINLIIDDNE